MVGVLRFRNSETGEWQEINAIKGEPGKDYVLTEADKEEIAQSVGTDNFYTRSEIDNKLDEINIPNLDDYYKKSEVYNKDEVDDKLKDVDVDLSDYYTKTEIDEALNNVSVDLSSYYTKTEIDDLLANLPAGDIPSGEEVEW